MLELEKMQKIRIITLREKREKIINALYDFGAIEIKECKTASFDRPLPSFEKLSEMLIRLRAIERMLDLKGNGKAIEKGGKLSELEKEYSALNLETAEEHQRKHQELKSRMEKLLARKEELLPFRKLDLHAEKLRSETLNFAYFALKKDAYEKLKKETEKFSSQLLFIKDNGNQYVLLAYSKKEEEKAQMAILKNAALVYQIPEAEGSFETSALENESEIRKVEAEISAHEKEEAVYKRKNAQSIESLRKKIEVEAKKAELPFKFGATENLAVIEGWIESKNLQKMKRLAEKEEALLEEAKTGDVPPSKLKNPRLIKPFEFLTEFYSLPKSYELDPTLFVAISFPIFFGMILGDVGYGLVSLLVAFLIRSKSKDIMTRRLAGMLALSATSTIIFGYVFGEFFGLEHIFGYELHPMINRIEDSTALLNLSILFGVIHVSLGLLLGITSKWREGHKNHAIGKAGWLILELSMIALILQTSEISLIEILTPLKYAIPYPFSAILFVLGLFLIAKFESPTNLLELPGLISNVLSYLRLAALGIAGVVLALIVNQSPVDYVGVLAMFAGKRAFDFGALASFIIFLAIFIIGHVGSMILGLVEASIQTLRLHYVEFFSKFYEGGGFPFSPLRKSSASETKNEVL